MRHKLKFNVMVEDAKVVYSNFRHMYTMNTLELKKWQLRCPPYEIDRTCESLYEVLEVEIDVPSMNILVGDYFYHPVVADYVSENVKFKLIKRTFEYVEEDGKEEMIIHLEFINKNPAPNPSPEELEERVSRELDETIEKYTEEIKKQIEHLEKQNEEYRKNRMTRIIDEMGCEIGENDPYLNKFFHKEKESFCDKISRLWK